MEDKISDDELLRDLLKADTKVEGKLTTKEYIELGEYSLRTIQLRFETFNKAKEQIGLETNSKGRQSLSEEEIVDNIKHLVYDTDKQFTVANLADQLDLKKGSLKIYFQHGTQTPKKFNGLFDAVEAAGITQEDIYERWEQVILDEKMYGWVDYSEFKNKLVEQSQFGFYMNVKKVDLRPASFIEYVNEKEGNGLSLNRTGPGGNGSSVFVKNQNVDPYAKYRERIPDDEQAREAFQRCIGHGYSPKTSLAALIYIFTDKTQDEVRRDIGCAEMSIRNVRDFIKENEMVEPWPNQID